MITYFEVEDGDLSSYIAKTVINYRLSQNYSQRQLAEKMGVPNSTIARLESGQTGINLKTIEKFCSLSGFRLEFLAVKGCKRSTIVAHYILKNLKQTLSDDYDVTNMKLQKLLYYTQVFNLGKTTKPMFENEFRAWEHGPVHLSVYHKFKEFGSNPIDLNEQYLPSTELSEDEMDIIDLVLDCFGRKSAFDLRYQSHNIDGNGNNPWKRAMLRGKNEPILAKDMLELYKIFFKDAL